MRNRCVRAVFGRENHRRCHIRRSGFASALRRSCGERKRGERSGIKPTMYPPGIQRGGYNFASYLVAHSLKMLPNGTFVVSYADTAWSHVGYVYQATNFLYTGMSAKRTDTYQPGGLHPRAYDKNNHSELMQTRSQKHRYVYLVGSKTQRKRMLTALKYPVIRQYPKGDEKQYDTNNPKPITETQIVERKKPKQEKKA